MYFPSSGLLGPRILNLHKLRQ